MRKHMIEMMIDHSLMGEGFNKNKETVKKAEAKRENTKAAGKTSEKKAGSKSEAATAQRKNEK
jgi:hypothetical protein